VGRLLPHRDARIYLAGAAAVAVLDYRILLAVMAAVMLVAAGYLARVPASPVRTAAPDIVAASNRVQR
jgi:hypothetical protein